MPAPDSKASLRERVLASPIHDGPVEREELMGIGEHGVVQRAPEDGGVVLRGAEVG